MSRDEFLKIIWNPDTPRVIFNEMLDRLQILDKEQIED